MRDIRFRAWDLVTEKLYRVNCIDFKNNHVQLQDDDGTITDLLDTVKLMQYTGTKDKNGKDIFEGDILQGGHYPIAKDDGYVLVIEYDHDRFWAVRTMKSTTDVRGISHGIADGLYEFEDSDLEVIGNIYENPNMIMD